MVTTRSLITTTVTVITASVAVTVIAVAILAIAGADNASPVPSFTRHLMRAPSRAHAQDFPARIYAHLPVLTRNHPLRDPDTAPPPLASPTSGAAPTSAPTAPPTAEPSPVPLPCLPLADRVLVADVDIAARNVALRAGRGRWPVAMFLAPHPEPDSDRRAIAAWVGWSDGSKAYLTPLDADDGRAGPDIPLPAQEVRGLTVHPDGSPAALLVQGDELRLARWDVEGNEALNILVIGDNGHRREGDKWSEAFSYESRLVWSEPAGEYGVYAGHSGHFGGNGVHQGDLFWRFTIEGERVPAGLSWDWGCSHSLDVRLAHNGTRFGPVCLSDIYPAKGFNFGYRQSLLRAEPSGNGGGSSAARLGGWVPVADGFLLSFASPEGRASRDVGLLHAANDGTPTERAWLTDTRSVEEGSPHLARYGPAGDGRLLVGWTAGDAHHIATIDEQGVLLEGPIVIEPTLAARLDMHTTVTGDVLWASAWEPLDRLRIVRIEACHGELPR
jgi:hypothetical protein